MSVVEFASVTKRFDSVTALDAVSFVVPQGSVFGLLGPNGAGKTTALRLLLGLSRPTSGTVRILGGDPVNPASRAKVGFLPDVPGFVDWMTGAEYLSFSAKLAGAGADATRDAELLELVDLSDAKGRIGGYSRGMRQRLGIAQSLVGSPELLVLDEPTSALDPGGRAVLLDLVDRLREHATVVFSTHLLDDVERVCDRVLVIDRGQVLADSTIDELKTHVAGSTVVRLVLDDDGRPLLDSLRTQAWVTSADASAGGRELHIVVGDLNAARVELPRLCVEAGLGIVALNDDRPGLQDIFLSLVGGAK